MSGDTSLESAEVSTSGLHDATTIMTMLITVMTMMMMVMTTTTMITIMIMVMILLSISMMSQFAIPVCCATEFGFLMI